MCYNRAHSYAKRLQASVAGKPVPGEMADNSTVETRPGVAKNRNAATGRVDADRQAMQQMPSGVV